MRRARQPLDGWQVDSLELMLAARADGKWACREYCEWLARQNGKGTVLEARVLTGFLLLGEQNIFWSAHLHKTALALFRRMIRLIRALGTRVKPHDDNLWWVDGTATDPESGEIVPSRFIVKIVHSHGEEGFERLDTEARVMFIARSAGSGRGMGGDLNIVDEALFYTAEMHQALLYALSASPNAQIVYMSSPPLKGDQASLMYALRRRGDPAAPRGADDGEWSQDRLLGYRDWGAPGDLDEIQVDIDDPAVAAATNPALGAIRGNGSGLSMETIDHERLSDRPGFPRERLGIWPREVRTEDGGAIDMKAWADLADADSKRQGDIAVAFAVAQDRSWAAMAVRGLRSDGLGHWEVIEHRPGPPTWIPARAKTFREKHADHLIGFVIDERGPAGSLVSKLEQVGIKRPEKPDEPKRGDLAVTSASNMAAAFGLMRDAITLRTGRHRDDPRLNTSWAAAGKRVIGDGAEALGRKGAADITCAEAVTLAEWLYESWGHLTVTRRSAYEDDDLVVV